MSSESIIYDRRNRSDDFGAELDGQCDENDGNIINSRRAFERQRSWKSRSDADAGGKSPRSPSRVEGDGREEGAPAATVPLGRYAHKFFSEEMASCREAYLKLIGRATIIVIILTWSCLPVYWASLSASADLTGNLEAWVINRDQARIGDSLAAAALAAPSSGHGALWWRLINASYYPADEDVLQAVLQERTWLAVVVNTNASTSLSRARAIGNSSYNPSSAITVYYAQARNEVVTGTYLLPAASGLLSNFTVNYATSSTQRYLATIVSQDDTLNLTALQGIAQAPQTISPGIGYSLVNLRPYTTPTAQAPLLVGQIYLCIFAFIIVMAHSTARARIEKHLTLPSYLLLRILTPLIVYIPLSLSYALLNLAFRLPFGTHFSFGAGFLAFFGFLYLGMTSLGLALEAMVTLLQPRFVPLFLVLLLIVNVSTAALPAELQPRLYSYGSGFQFWNVQQGLRTIFFDTYSHLQRNAGILVAWVIISCCTTALFTWLVRAREVRSAYRLGVDMGRGEKVKDVEYGKEKKGKGVVGSVVVMDDVREGKVVDEIEMKKGKGNGAGAGEAFKRWEKMKDNSVRNAKLEEERAPESSEQSKSGSRGRGR